MKNYVFAVLFVALCAFGQDKSKTTAPPVLKPVVLSIASENTLLKAENDLGVIRNAELDIQNKFYKISQQATDLKKQYKEVAAKELQAQKNVENAIEAAWKESGLDKANYDFAVDTFTFVPKTANKK
jgi:hypothetical protein